MNSLPVLFQDKQLQSEIEKYSRKKHLGKDDILMETGDSIQFIPLVQAGVLRIMRQDTDGNEVFIPLVSRTNLRDGIELLSIVKEKYGEGNCRR